MRVSPAGARDRISGDTRVLDSSVVVRTRWSKANEPGRSGSTVNRSWNNTVREPRRMDSAAAAKLVRRASVAKAARGTAKRSRSGATVACPRHAPIDSTGGGPPADARCDPTISICSGGSSSPAAAKSGA